MGKTTIDHLIINSPYEEPKHHWSYDRETRTFDLKEGRRSAGYVIASQTSKVFDDPGIFVEIPLVNQIRPRVKAWREAGYPGVTGITKRLLEHWYNQEERTYPFFFCQVEAIETLIWLAEAPAADKVGIDIPSDGGPFTRLCSKMATGSGKTIVMAMLIAWQVINKTTYPQDIRFSKYIFVIAPGLTVKDRLKVLMPTEPENFYDEFSVVPTALLDKLRQGNIRIRNWHTLNWETEEKIAKKKTVDKRGAKSDEAYVREVLGELSTGRNILVINDEAHHAWRIPAESKIKGLKKEDIEEATKWVGGLDRIHRARGILSCYDFSATPFAPSGKQSSEEALFDWIVSDFGLNDAIESGLVKTPRVVVRDEGVPDAKTYKPKLYHIYEHVKEDLNRKAEAHRPLPALVTVGYYLLGKDWLVTAEKWKKRGLKTPPVIITVANRTETAARVNYAFTRKKILIDELCIPERILHIDSKVLGEAESQEEAISLNGSESFAEDEQDEDPTEKLSKKEKAEFLRRQVDTVGKEGKAGEKIQNVISVGMLSEGWDARTVTHIMGLRAFSSQLLCEQVVGRGLRRTSYEINRETNLYEPEYVNIFGVPFTFLPHEAKEDGPHPRTTPAKLEIKPVDDKRHFEIKWPNIIRIDHVFREELRLDLSRLRTLELDAYKTPTLVEMAPIVDGKPDLSRISEIDLIELGKKNRWQRIIFQTSSDIFDHMKPTWKGNKDYLLAQIIRVVAQFISSGAIQINPPLFNQDDFKRRILITLNMSTIVQHAWEAITSENAESLIPVFDSQRPILSTGDMRPWHTGKPCKNAKRSHINKCVYDSTWESSDAFQLDHNDNVQAWVKNDHLGFEVLYIYQGIVHKYRPDFLVRLKNGTMLVLETKGQDTDQDKTKREFLDEWVRAVNQHGGFGKWDWGVSRQPLQIAQILEQKAKKSLPVSGSATV